MSFDSGDSIDTGIMAFDGDGFRIQAEFKMNTSNNINKYIVAALEPVGTQGNNTTYAGFALTVYKSNTVRIMASTGAAFKTGWWGSQIVAITTKTTEQTYTIDLTYDNKRITGTFAPNSSSGTTSIDKSSAYFPTTLNNATIVIGGNGEPGYEMNGMTVYSFKVTKL